MFGMNLDVNSCSYGYDNSLFDKGTQSSKAPPMRVIICHVRSRRNKNRRVHLGNDKKKRVE